MIWENVGFRCFAPNPDTSEHIRLVHGRVQTKVWIQNTEVERFSYHRHFSGNYSFPACCDKNCEQLIKLHVKKMIQFEKTP